MDLTEVSNILWRERQLLELLVFKLAEEKLVVGLGRPTWQVHAAREVEAVAGELRRVELERAVKVQSWATSHGIDGEPSLRKLCDAVPGAWGMVLGEHRREMLALVEEVRCASSAPRADAPVECEDSRADARDDSEACPESDVRVETGESPTADSDEAAASDGARARRTIEVIVQELRRIGAVAGLGSGPIDAPVESWGAGPGSEDELTRVVVDLQLHEIAQHDNDADHARMLQRSLVEFLR